MDQETAQELLRQIFTFHRAVRVAASHAATNGGTGLALEGVLRMISEHDGCRASDLATELGIGASSLSRQIGDLEDLGLVRRRTCPTDKRAQLLTLSEAGEAHLSDIQRNRAETIGAALGNWSEERGARAVNVLAGLTEAMRTIQPTTTRATATGNTADQASHTLAGALS